MADEKLLEPEIVPRANPKIPLILGLVAGLVLGGGGAVGYFIFSTQQMPHEEKAIVTEVRPQTVTPRYFNLDHVRAPLIDMKRAHILNYVDLDLQIEVASEADIDYLRKREPILRHAANAQLSEKGVANANNPRQIDFEAASAQLMQAFNESLDKPVIKAVHIIKGTRI